MGNWKEPCVLCTFAALFVVLVYLTVHDLVYEKASYVTTSCVVVSTKLKEKAGRVGNVYIPMVEVKILNGTEMYWASQGCRNNNAAYTPTSTKAEADSWLLGFVKNSAVPCYTFSNGHVKVDTDTPGVNSFLVYYLGTVALSICALGCCTRSMCLVMNGCPGQDPNRDYINDKKKTRGLKDEDYDEEEEEDSEGEESGLC